MSKTKTTAINFSEVLKKARLGTYKLPAFQRKWRWSTKQVMSFYDSLRLGYPIGAFLFYTSEDAKKLAPRNFHGTGKKALSNLKFESLVLDGQQRITAGLSLYYGLEDIEGSEYYIDLKKIESFILERKLNIEDEEAVEKFCDSLEIDDGYLVAKRKRSDRSSYFYKSKLLWTAYLSEHNQIALETLIEECNDKEVIKVIKNVVRRFLKPNINIQIPVIELGNEFDLAGISKVFSTINSTGKLLTPFELVVAILYPDNITLEDDILEYKSKYSHYNNMDKNGEILLQTIALLANKSPKKSDLPKNIDHTIYTSYAPSAASYLDEAGKFLSMSVGMGLDVTDKLIPYDAIFAPFCICYNHVQKSITKSNESLRAKNKLKRWVVASAITQRYQEGIHNKQENDLKDIKKWLINDDDIPNWIRDASVTINIRNASPSGAIGKLIICLLNSSGPKDPVINEAIGFKDKAHQSQIHHIYPTKWVSKGIVDYKEDKVNTNLALNTMILSSETNGDWLNFEPKAQINQSLQALSNQRNAMLDIYDRQLISRKAVQILEKGEMYIEDYHNFIEERYKSLVQKLKEFDISEAEAKGEYPTELESPSIVNEPSN